ncbi:type III PLP-dependent enzyme [Aliiroseovarius crassostreae]|uniref:type III PLP-dependent enzyme n=1 Tax=Aliiroseovarius crassostreae TaxID=154981 RepID=UPI0021FEE8B6|nr:type III PLP-dependent enzyme [Aliiroseovarius crassostreae]UWP89859.1 type III PLP-dependent enzyme [Aliiroseovarius crassostreae]
MSKQPSIWTTVLSHLKLEAPKGPVLYFAPAVLQATARRFVQGFDGVVTYAVKANDLPVVLENLVAAGLSAFDVASPAEMRALRAVSPDVVMHYNNPVRSPEEIDFAVEMGVASYSVDSLREFEKLRRRVPSEGIEMSVRLCLPVEGAAYHFGEKFGADPELAAELLKQVAAAGFVPSMTFHPGTQCADPAAWVHYIEVCADIAEAAGVTLSRLNVGGGFAANRGVAPDLERIFDAIHDAVEKSFGATPPQLVCEPGRAMVADAFTLATRVKAVRDNGDVFLNDGIYGALAEAPQIGTVNRMRCLRADGAGFEDALTPRVIYGPTCDSIDRLPDPMPLPEGLAEGDIVLFDGMGAYSFAMATRFNGYGVLDLVTVQDLQN